ncbi:MAG: peptidoglycan-binding protein [Tildeniella nuda ZEHNDER 1965/U140]|jgi:peptidoglycan hydrolase-like protein with peptidoglycan-binding domain|nr:peptidoglycan-binding protein [Tildeniella nuda ZEHNDER 1965/U140]
METFAYLHTACAYDDPEAVELTLNVEQLNVKQWSGQASLLMLQLLVPAAILAVAGHASALQVGDRGPSVTVLQDRLRSAGYFNRNPTGVYASITADSVRRFQRDRGLTVDGIAGPATQRALRGQSYATSENFRSISSSSISNSLISSSSISSNSISNSSFISATSNSTFSTGGLLRFGSRGSDVRALQQQLNARSYSVRVDGIFGSETDRAVRRFQSDNNLVADGIVGSDTRYALGLSPIASGSVCGNGLAASSRKCYVVVVPLKNSAILTQVRQYVPGAFIASSNLGKYVYAGDSDQRGLAEAEATRLRARGLDAQVRYF